MPKQSRASNSHENRQINRSTILNLLLQHQPTSRTRLAELTGLSNPTVSNIVRELLQSGVVVEGNEEISDKPRIGRRRQLLQLKPNARLALAFHLGWPRAAVGIVNLNGDVLAQEAIPQHLVQTSSSEAVTEIAEYGLALLRTISPEMRERVLAAGVAVPRYPWHNTDIQTPLQDALNMPVVVENNVHSMAIGEFIFGRHRQHTSMAFLYIGAGIGAGIILNGELWYGNNRHAGELIGHLRVTTEDIPCRCGNTGCFEATAGENAIADLFRAEYPEYASLDTNAVIPKLIDLAQGNPNSPRTQRVLHTISERLYFGVAALSNLYNPEIIVLGGRLLELDNLLLEPIRHVMDQRNQQGIEIVTPIESSKLDENIALTGSGALAHVQEVFSPKLDLPSVS